MISDNKILATASQILTEQGVKNFQFIGRRENILGGEGHAVTTSSSGLLLQFKHVRPTSIDEVLGILAVEVLKSRQRTRNNVLVPLLIFKRLGDKTRRSVRQFMTAHAPDCGWGLIDQSGAAQIVVPALSLDVDQPGQISPPSWPRQRPMRLFSDLNQWMLKILLLADTPTSLWGGPRQSVATPTDLHRVAHVSVEKAHQFYRAFEQIGLIRPTRSGLVVVRKKDLMEMWVHDELSRSARRMPTRWIFGEPPSLEQVFCKQGAPGDFAVCGFEACRVLGVLHSPVMNREVYFLGDAEAALEAWDLEACDDRDAHFYLRKARSAQSVLRGRVVKENLPVVDVLQAALDVCDQSSRGIEQSQYIINHILGWRDGE
jgi:hypothetical protein